MRRALDLALQGWGRVAPNPLVGAVVLQGDRAMGVVFRGAEPTLTCRKSNPSPGVLYILIRGSASPRLISVARMPTPMSSWPDCTFEKRTTESGIVT